MNKKVLIALILCLIGFLVSSIFTRTIPTIGSIVAPGNWGFTLVYADLSYFGGQLIIILSLIFAIRGYLEIRKTNENGKSLSLVIIVCGNLKLIIFILNLMHLSPLPVWFY